MKLLNRILNIVLGDLCIELEALEQKPIALPLPEKVYLGQAKLIVFRKWGSNVGALYQALKNHPVTGGERVS